MEECMITLDAEPISAQDAATWAASITCEGTVEDVVELLLSLDTITNSKHSLAARNALALHSALKQALRRILN